MNGVSGPSDTIITTGLAVVCSIYIILIFIVFILKGRTKRREGIIYFSTLILSFLSLATYIVAGYTVVIGNNIYLLFSRLHIFFSVIWIFLVVQYIVMLFIDTNHVIDKKKYLIYVPMGIFCLINVILCYFLPISFTRISVGKPYVLSGSLVTYYNVLIALFIVFFIIVFLVKRKMLDRHFKLMLVCSIGCLAISFAVKYIFGFEISNKPLIISLFITFLYFTSESQDSNLLVEYNESAKKSEESDKLKSEFIMNMSHQLRTPMNSILGFSELILLNDDLTLESVKEDTLNIKTSSKYLLDLINAILDLSKLESDKAIVYNENYNLDNVIYDISSSINSKLRENIVFTINADEICPNDLVGDGYKLFKILSIILMNAVNHTEYGEVSLNISCTQIDSLNYEFTFLIKNSGHIMKVEDFNRNFEDLVRLSNDDNSSISVESLNLVVAKGLINIIGGTVEFINESGKGTQYIIKLKQKLSGQGKLGNIKEKIQTKYDMTHQIINLLGKKVLIIDEDKVNMSVVHRLMSQYNISIETSLNPRDGIDLVNNNNYDLIIVNHNMNDMKGDEVVNKLSTSANKVPPIIGIVTKVNDVNGIYNYKLESPIEFKELNKIINDIFKGGVN